MVCWAERLPTNARAQRQKSVGSVLSKEESRLWKSLGQDPTGIREFGFYFKFSEQPRKDFRQQNDVFVCFLKIFLDVDHFSSLH